MSSPPEKEAPVRAPGRYHHGDLRAALMAASEAILLERGVEGFTLREAARRAGVSPAAPAHHFGDARGLLTALAVQGFETLGAYLRAGEAQGGSDPARRLKEQGLAYVRFALDHPARFDLMFRRARLNAQDPALVETSQAAFSVLQEGVAAIPGAGSPERASIRALAAWSTVHGFARLALDGEFDRFAGEVGLHAFTERLLPMILEGPG
jgi:AcrR family transcriptional regulator